MSDKAFAPLYKRSNYYIDKDFQSKFIVKFCGLVVVGAALTIVLLYFMAQYATTVSIVKARVQVMTATDFILPFLLQTVVIVTILVGLGSVGVTLFVSHKIAGPLFRFKQTLKELSSGNFSHQVRLRKDDQLQTFATEFNDMITVIRDKVRAAEQELAAVQKDIHLIGDFNGDEQKRKQFADLKHKVATLEKTIKFFRI